MYEIKAGLQRTVLVQKAVGFTRFTEPDQMRSGDSVTYFCRHCDDDKECTL